MTTLDARQTDTAQEIVETLKVLRPGRNALWQLSGAVGSGKTTVLRRVAELLPYHDLTPIFVSAPSGEIDSAAIALLETAEQLKSKGLLNGEMSIISDPARSWPEKMDVITGVLDNHHQDVVILCDEPTLWYRSNESLIDDTPAECGRSLGDWITNDTACRRVVAGWISNDSPAGRNWAPAIDDGRELLEPDFAWGSLQGSAADLRKTLDEPIPKRSAWEMKLTVALSALAASDEIAWASAPEATAGVVLAQVFDQLERRPDFGDLGQTLARLALARTNLDKVVLSEFTSGLEPLKRDLIGTCLMDWDAGRGQLHPLVRHGVFLRASDSRRRATNSIWRLPKADRLNTHDRLQNEYARKLDASLRVGLESLHHELLGTARQLMQPDERICFPEQLDEIGRTLSYVDRDHSRAAEIFRFSISLNSRRAYSHHYLAFNLDWEAKNALEVEMHYRKAIELQPTHPWWWSRWISYLATRGRFLDAKTSWRAAINAMSISEDSAPPWIFMSLHRWVARWLLHWAELDFAEEVLRSIPRTLTENDTSIQTLWDLLKALRQAERGVSVFPLSVPAKDWWSSSPHTDLPRDRDGRTLRDWFPARIEGVDKENAVVFLVAAKRPPKNGTNPVYFEIELTRDQIEQAVCGLEWDDVREGIYVELGFYGDRNDAGCIGVHRETTWDDPNLLPLVPPPDRWYRRAVEGAWAEMAGND